MRPSIQYRLGVFVAIAILYYVLLRYKFVYPPQRQGFTGKGLLLLGVVLMIYFLFFYESALSPAITSAYGFKPTIPGYA